MQSTLPAYVGKTELELDEDLKASAHGDGDGDGDGNGDSVKLERYCSAVNLRISISPFSDHCVYAKHACEKFLPAFDRDAQEGRAEITC
jgi:hypothetical protein